MIMSKNQALSIIRAAVPKLGALSVGGLEDD
jgi:hypothetical protein